MRPRNITSKGVNLCLFETCNLGIKRRINVNSKPYTSNVQQTLRVVWFYKRLEEGENKLFKAEKIPAFNAFSKQVPFSTVCPLI